MLDRAGKHGRVARVSVIFLLVLAYLLLALYFRVVLQTSVVYTHFVYIPVVLAGMWWGKRGIFFAAALAAATLLLRVFLLPTAGFGPDELWSDLARVFFILVVSICVGTLSDRLCRSRRALRKQEEQLVHSTRLAELGEMAAAMAHELNQPLTGIRNFARNAQFMIEEDAGSPDDVKLNLERISRQVDRASRLIRQVRSLARRSELSFSPMELNASIEESVEFLMPQFNLAKVDVNLELSKDLPRVHGDRTRLDQVFLNLLNNARQAMEGCEQPRLSVKTRFEEGAARPVVIEIADSGKGFSEEEAAKLFVPFYTTKKVGQGTGLGLSISLGIVQEHGGRLAAERNRQGGATFEIRLPVAMEGGR